MNLRDLRYLVAVADHRHFGRAAEACHVSQPTLSAQIKKLERFLEVQLVERSNRQVLLTPTGEAVTARARTILSTAADIVDVARAGRDPLAGDLRLGLIPTIAPYLLPHLVPALRRELPRLRPLLVEDQTGRCLEQLRHGAIDAAIMAVPVAGDEGFAQEALYDEPFLLAAPSGHPLAGQEVIALDDLTGAPMLLLEEGHCLRDQALDVCRRVGAGEAREFRATSLETLRQMVVAGAGMTLLPQMTAQANATAGAAEGVVLRRFREPQPQRHVAILWRTGAAREATIRAVAATIRQLDVVRELSPAA